MRINMRLFRQTRSKSKIDDFDLMIYCIVYNVLRLDISVNYLIAVELF